jgi:hypothetical protein
MKKKMEKQKQLALMAASSRGAVVDVYQDSV